MKKTLVGVLALIIVWVNGLQSQNVDNESIATANNLNEKVSAAHMMGRFLEIKTANGATARAYVAGPSTGRAGILLVHDFFGITDATIESAEKLGALGYRTIAVDLYNGKSASTNDSANVLLKSKDSAVTAQILRAGIDYLKKQGIKLAVIGYSAGGLDAMNAALMEPDLFAATVIVYGGNYDKIEKTKIDKLKSPVLAIAGTLDNWPVDAALNFFKADKTRLFEMYFYPGVEHGYAQPLFNAGKNYNAEATRVTWLLMEDFLKRNLQ